MEGRAHVHDDGGVFRRATGHGPDLTAEEFVFNRAIVLDEQIAIEGEALAGGHSHDPLILAGSARPSRSAAGAAASPAIAGHGTFRLETYSAAPVSTGGPQPQSIFCMTFQVAVSLHMVQSGPENMDFRLVSFMRKTRIQPTTAVTKGETDPPPNPAVMLWLIQFV